MSFRQRAVIEFLVKEEIPAEEIHQRLQRAYGSVCMGALYYFKSTDFLLYIPYIWITKDCVFLKWSMFVDRH
jgi:hypothetical protein